MAFLFWNAMNLVDNRDGTISGNHSEMETRGARSDMHTVILPSVCGAEYRN